jgi:hypothetical protein
MQSHDYVPGVSGWKFNQATGEFELNSCKLGCTDGAPDRQMVSVEVASYSKHDMPKNAGELLAFMQAELQKVPAEYRQVAEFEDFDASYGDDCYSTRVFLSYHRPETDEELAERIEKSKSAGTHLKLVDGLLTINQGGVTRARFGDLNKAVQPDPKPRTGFYVPIPGAYVDADGRLCISEAKVERASITNAKLGPDWSVKMASVPSGEKFVCGMGLGLESHDSQFLVDADRYAVGGYVGNGPQPGDAPKVGSATSMLDAMASKISETSLGKGLLNEIGKGPTIADQVRDVLRAELKPGGILWRGR